MRRPLPLYTLLALALALVVLLAAGCSGADVTTDSTAPDEATEAAETTPAPAVTATTEPATDTATATDGTEAAGDTTATGGVDPQALCDAFEASGIIELLDLQVSSIEPNDGSIGLPGCSPTFEGGPGGTVVSLAIEQPDNYGGATGADLLERIRSGSDTFLGEGQPLDAGGGGYVWPQDADGDPGAFAAALVGDKVITMIVDGDVAVEDVSTAMTNVVAELGG